MSTLAGRMTGELLDLLGAGEISAAEVVRDHLARIEERNGELGAFLCINPLAEREAEEIDRRRSEAGLSAMYRKTRGACLGPEVRRRIMLGTFALSAGYQDRFYAKAQQARSLIRNDFREDLLLRAAAVIEESVGTFDSPCMES